jgi:putative membrane protein
MKQIILTATFMMAATVASAQSTAESTGINSAVGAAPTTEDFVLQASASGLYEIESSKLALQKGDDAVKKFAQQMISDHEKASAELKASVVSGKATGTPVTVLTEDHKEEIDELAALEGTAFSEEYVDDQVDAHEDAIDLFKRYAEGGDNTDLKNFAMKTLPILEHHYEMIQQMDQ